jgi:menaquinone-specific isochorismate synthase
MLTSCPRPAEGFAVAGAEAVLNFSARGPERFADCQRFIDETLANTLAVGPQTAAFSGPHFFTAFSFFDDIEAGEPFEAAAIFVPRWQVAVANGRTTAVANLLVEIDSPLDALTERVWRARKKFGAFDYSAPDFQETAPATPTTIREVGGPGAYAESVRRAVERIEAGEFEKIVLARAKDIVASQPFHPLRF